MRLDKWLWAARFFRTRSLAQQAIGAGRVKIGDSRVKPAHDLKVGDLLVLKKDDLEWRILVEALSERRGPPQVARTLYEETDASRVERERRLDLRRFGPDPAAGIKGRPTKKDRRSLDSFLEGDDW